MSKYTQFLKHDKWKFKLKLPFAILLCFTGLKCITFGLDIAEKHIETAPQEAVLSKQNMTAGPSKTTVAGEGYVSLFVCAGVAQFTLATLLLMKSGVRIKGTTPPPNDPKPPSVRNKHLSARRRVEDKTSRIRRVRQLRRSDRYYDYRGTIALPSNNSLLESDQTSPQHVNVESTTVTSSEIGRKEEKEGLQVVHSTNNNVKGFAVSDEVFEEPAFDHECEMYNSYAGDSGLTTGEAHNETYLLIDTKKATTRDGFVQLYMATKKVDDKIAIFNKAAAKKAAKKKAVKKAAAKKAAKKAVKKQLIRRQSKRLQLRRPLKNS